MRSSQYTEGVVDAQLKALTDPIRRAILQRLKSDQLPAGAIAQYFRISRPAISRHLGVLNKAGLVQVRTVGTSRYYGLRPNALADLRSYLAEFG